MTTEVIWVRGEADGLNTLAVYYRVGVSSFRARLRPAGDGTGLELTEVEEIRLPEDDDVDEAEVVRNHWVERVPNLVREALDRPVQAPDTGVVHG